MFCKISLPILLFFMVDLAWAFDEWEHKRLGDLSYYLAVEIFCEKNTNSGGCDSPDGPNAGRSLRGKFYDAVRGSTGPEHKLEEKKGEVVSENISYGDIVMCVDYFLTPEKLIAGREHHLIQGAIADDGAISKGERKEVSGDEKFVHSSGLFPQNVKDLSFDVVKRCDPDYLNLEGARAGHVNHSHFQSELLVAQRTSHLLALAIGRSERNVFSAFAINAISDHYLHDAFAPGHITTTRSRLTDTAANAFHDFNNRAGLDVSVDLNKMKMTVDIGSDKKKFDLLSEIIEKINFDVLSSDYFFRPGKIGDVHCGGKCRSSESDLARLATLKDIFGVRNENILVRLKGDGNLWAVEQDKQRLLMLWTSVRSIYDVLKSIPEMNPDPSIPIPTVFNDSFKNNSDWKWVYTAADKDNRLFGAAPSKIDAGIGPIQYSVKFIDKEEVIDDTGKREWVNYRKMDKLWGVSYGIDNMTFGDAQNRKILNFESYLGGKASRGRTSENWAVVGGFQAYSGLGPDGIALTGRVVYVMPATETGISIQARALRLARHNAPAMWKLTMGGRMDFGFTSFMTMYIQGGRDFAVQKDDGVRSGWSIGAGIQLVAPTCRIPGIKAIAKCD
jgi:hypothetical protein